MNKIHAKKPFKYKNLVILITLLLLVVTLALIVINKDKSLKPESGVIKTSKSQNNNASSNKSNSPNSGNSDKIASGSGNENSGEALIEPYGSFVSNHKPGQNGSNLLMSSQCITSVGATCRIEFKKDGVTRKLPDQKVDANGMTIWDWKTDTAGLTRGSWEVSAVATINGQTKTTTDKILLEITQ